MRVGGGVLCGILALALCAAPSSAQQSATSEAAKATSLMDHMTGDWVLQGTIAGKRTTHDVQARWVLRREYIQMHEVSREKDESGRPAYEAIVYLSWDPKTQEYVCMWLDSTAGGGLSAEGLAHGKPAPDAIPLRFVTSPTDGIKTIFHYDSNSDTWNWTIDNLNKDKESRFADVKLTRTKSP